MLIDHYEGSENPVVNEDGLRAEWEIFRVLMKQTYPNHTLHQMQQLLAGSSTLKSLYPNLSTSASIALILPVSTADCERAFSTMKRVKTELQNRMSTKTLNQLLQILQIHIEGPKLEEFNFDKAVDTWGKMKNRRITV